MSDLPKTPLAADTAAPPATSAPTSQTPKLVAGTVILLAALIGGWIWYSGRNIESTDDAFV